jgi:hypothetical protein
MRETQYKGDVAVSQAIATFTRLGLDVSIPLTESASYDLIVDVDGRLIRVQVRYSSARQVALRRVHSNSKGYVVKPPKPDSYDWLYILKSNGEEYLIKDKIANRNSLVPKKDNLLQKKI